MTWLGNLAPFAAALLFLLIIVAYAIRILREYERGVIFTLAASRASRGRGSS